MLGLLFAVLATSLNVDARGEATIFYSGGLVTGGSVGTRAQADARCLAAETSILSCTSWRAFLAFDGDPDIKNAFPGLARDDVVQDFLRNILAVDWSNDLLFADFSLAFGPFWSGFSSRGVVSETCSNWTSNSSVEYGRGGHVRLGQYRSRCSARRTLLCICGGAFTRAPTSRNPTLSPTQGPTFAPLMTVLYPSGLQVNGGYGEANAHARCISVMNSTVVAPGVWRSCVNPKAFLTTLSAFAVPGYDYYFYVAPKTSPGLLAGTRPVYSHTGVPIATSGTSFRNNANTPYYQELGGDAILQNSLEYAGVCSGNWWTLTDDGVINSERDCSLPGVLQGSFASGSVNQFGIQAGCGWNNLYQAYNVYSCDTVANLICSCQGALTTAAPTTNTRSPTPPTAKMRTRSPTLLPSGSPTPPTSQRPTTRMPSKAPSRTPSISPRHPSKAPTTSAPSQSPTMYPLANIVYSAGITVDGGYTQTNADARCATVAPTILGPYVSACVNPRAMIEKTVAFAYTPFSQLFIPDAPVFSASGVKIALRGQDMSTSSPLVSLQSAGACQGLTDALWTMANPYGCFASGNSFATTSGSLFGGVNLCANTFVGLTGHQTKRACNQQLEFLCVCDGTRASGSPTMPPTTVPSKSPTTPLPSVTPTTSRPSVSPATSRPSTTPSLAPTHDPAYTANPTTIPSLAPTTRVYDIIYASNTAVVGDYGVGNANAVCQSLAGSVTSAGWPTCSGARVWLSYQAGGTTVDLTSLFSPTSSGVYSLNGTVLGDSPAQFIAGPQRTSFQNAGLCASGDYWTFSDAAGALDVRSCKSTGGFSFAEPIQRGAYGICTSTSSQEMISFSTLECYLPLQFMCICQSSGFKAGATRMPTSFAPSRSPSRTPSKAPTTSKPSKAPSGTPSRAPSRSPSKVPSRSPSKVPSRAPSKAPTTSKPSNAPTQSPTKLPTTLQPTTLAPTSKAPTSLAPTLPPTKAPTAPTASTIVNILFSAGIAPVNGAYGNTAAQSACSGAAAGVPGIKVSTCTSPAPFVSKIIAGVTTPQNAMMNANGVFHRSGTVLATSKAAFYSSGLVNSLSSVGICSTSYWSYSASDGSIDYSCPTDNLQTSWAETNGANSYTPSGGGATGSCTSTAGAHVYTTIVDCISTRTVICHCLGQTIF